MLKTLITTAGLSLLALTAQAATTTVQPGVGTLQAAIDAAASGDTLVLTDGMYSAPGSNGTIYLKKGVTIRTTNKSEVATIVSDFRTDSNFPNTDSIVIQNIRFLDNVNLSDARSLQFLENDVALKNDHVTSVTLRVKNAPTVESEISVIGNKISANEVAITGAKARFAGNSVAYGDSGVSLSGSNEMHVLGNSLAQGSSSRSSVLVNGSKCYYLGNKLSSNNETNDNGTSLSMRCSNQSTVANNIFTLKNAELRSTLNSSILSISRSSYGLVKNNIFNVPKFRSRNSGDSVIRFSLTPALVYNNIFLGTERQLHNGNPEVEVRYNFCQNSGTHCKDAHASNIDGDPKFIAGSYRLDTDSAAIDAGHPDINYNDVDKTLADMGVYGGAFPIDQFDVQREAGRTEPYVYPLFDASSDIANGNLNVKIMGYARMQ